MLGLDVSGLERLTGLVLLTGRVLASPRLGRSLPLNRLEFGLVFKCVADLVPLVARLIVL